MIENEIIYHYSDEFCIDNLNLKILRKFLVFSHSTILPPLPIPPRALPYLKSDQKRMKSPKNLMKEVRDIFFSSSPKTNMKLKQFRNEKKKFKKEWT